MTKLLPILIFATFNVIALSGCATSGSWAYSSGAESSKTDKENDSALVKTSWGSIKIFPKQINNWGLNVEVAIQNTSNKTIQFDSNSIKIQNSDGQILDPMNEQALKPRIAKATTLAGIVVDVYDTNSSTYNSAHASVTDNVFKSLIKSGDIPSHSSRTGMLYFDETKFKGNFQIRIAASLVGKEKIISFNYLEKKNSSQQLEN
jgi:hypothetical protein